MTSNSLPTMLDATLDPLAAIHKDLQAALVLAQQLKLSRPYLETIRAAITRLDDTWEEMNDIATTLNPDRGKHQP